MTDHDSSVLGDGAKAPEQPGCGEMVERVKAAICTAMEDHWDPGSREHCDGMEEACARAALAAMREPAGKMIDAGAATFGLPHTFATSIENVEPSLADFLISAIDGQPSRAWRAMIDAALAPQPEPVSRPTSPNTDESK